jgi:anti-sigma B factor antagonist
MEDKMAGNNDIIPGFDDEQQSTLKIKLSPISGIKGGMLIVLAGYVDTYNSNYFHDQISKVIDYNYLNLVFECSGLTGFASTGFGILTSLLKKVNQWGGDIVLTGLCPQIMETISLLGFAHFFKIVPTYNDAITILNGISTFRNEQDAVFPKMFNCPTCKRQLRSQHAGRFRCISCKTIIVIDENGNVTVG